MPKTMIPGGPTDKVRKNGGEELFVTLAIAMGGQRVDTCVYAVTRLMSQLGLSHDSLNQATELMTQMAADANSELELNWPERDSLMAAAIANFHSRGGHG